MQRLERVETLKLLLAEREYTTAADLAADLGVSVRTLHRDLAALRELGVPVAGLAGRGGGVYLERGWSLGRVHFNEREAIGVLLALAVAERTGSPMLLDDLRSIERKLVQAFAPSQLASISSLRRRVLVGAPASPAADHARSSRTRSGSTRALLEAFMQRRVVEIGYSDRRGVVSHRRIEPQYLYFSAPIWYVLAWDRLRQDVRSFRVDRITALDVTGEGFRLRAPDAFIDVAEHDARTL